MNKIKKSEISAVILSGGKSRRMHGQDKGLMLFNGNELVLYAIKAIKNYVTEVIVSANNNQDKYKSITNCRIIKDIDKDFKGPLAGIYAAMLQVKTPYLLVFPCDSPFITKDVLEKLCDNIKNNDIAVIKNNNKLQPTFSLLKSSLHGSLKKYLDAGDRKIDLWYKKHNLKIVDFIDNIFTNINSPKDYVKSSNITRFKNTPIIAFTAFSGVGKTTLIKQLITKLNNNNLRIAYIKHAHHNFDIDHKGKDSYECYHAGAKQVIVSSDKQFALINKYEEKEDVFALIDRLDLQNLDLVIVEGFKTYNIKKIELQRKELNHPNLYDKDDNIFAIATDDISKIKCNKVVVDINNIEEIYDFIVALI